MVDGSDDAVGDGATGARVEEAGEMAVNEDTINGDVTESIAKVFEKLGLGTPADRARYLAPEPLVPKPVFHVVISTTSTPNFG